MRNCVGWDKLELEVVRNYDPILAKKELTGLLPKRTYQAIQRMASSLGVKRIRRDFHPTVETRLKMSRTHLGRKLSEHHKAKIRIFILNESVSDILTEHCAYWIGFVLADANVCYKKSIPIMALHLKATDLPHLLKFRDFVCSSHKIGQYVNRMWGNASCLVSFSSEKMGIVILRRYS
jgi:hypothetical protein